MGYGDNITAIAGQKFSFNDETESYTAGEPLIAGKACFGFIGDSRWVFSTNPQCVVLTASAELVKGNILTVTVNGTSLGEIAFHESSAQTLKTVVARINASLVLQKLGIVASVGDSALTVNILSNGTTITASGIVTGGTTQATIIAVARTDKKFVGVVRHQELSYKDGVGFYPARTVVNVQTAGLITVLLAPGVNPVSKSNAFIVLEGTSAGMFTDNDEAYESASTFHSGRLDGSDALAILNLG
jgi:hypothetical protein